MAKVLGDQKEREPAWQEAILLLVHWTKDDLALLMVLYMNQKFIPKQNYHTVGLRRANNFYSLQGKSRNMLSDFKKDS